MLHVEASGGAGPRVLLLHSTGLSGRQWRRLAEELARRGHRITVPDLSGHGRSDPWPEPTPFDFHTDVEQISGLLEQEPTHLVGHSYGGFIALQAALHHPDQVASLILFEPTAFGALDARDADAREPLDSADLRWTATPSGRERWLQAFVDFWSGPGSWLRLSGEVRSEFTRVGWVLHEGVRTMLLDPTPASRYAALKIPTLLLRGTRSPLPARRVVERLAEALSGAHVADIDGAGHLGPLTHAEQVNRAVIEGVSRAAASRE